MIKEYVFIMSNLQTNYGLNGAKLSPFDTLMPGFISMQNRTYIKSHLIFDR